MLTTTVQGIYRGGRVILRAVPSDIDEETPVIVTFLSPESIDLRARGIDETQAASLRARLAPFAEDWDSPEMEIYNNYDAAQVNL